MEDKLGRTYKTGEFEKIEKKAAKKYGSEEAGDIFWNKARG